MAFWVILLCRWVERRAVDSAVRRPIGLLCGEMDYRNKSGNDASGGGRVSACLDVLAAVDVDF